MFGSRLRRTQRRSKPSASSMPRGACIRAPDIEFKASELGPPSLRLQHRQYRAGRGALCPSANQAPHNRSRERRRASPWMARRRGSIAPMGPRSRPRSWSAPTAGARSAGRLQGSRLTSGATTRARSPPASAMRAAMRASRSSSIARTPRSPPCRCPIRAPRP